MQKEIKEPLEIMCEAIQEMAAAFEELYKTLYRFTEQAQEEISKREKERKHWGHPPIKLIVAYKEPVKRIRPCARSFSKRR